MEAAKLKMAYDDGEDVAFNNLEVCNYRHLQTLAKHMGLPSNVKKIELIEMIRAKKYCSEKDLEKIVNRVKMQRRANAKLTRNIKKKLKLQGTEISTTNRSPPITVTPRRSSEYIIQYNSESPLDIMKNNPRPSVVEAGAPFLQKFKSDRILRSFNSMRRPNYRILDQTDCVVGVVKSRNTTIKEIRQERIQQYQEIKEQAFQSVNVTVQKQRPVEALMMNGDRQLVPVISRTLNTGPNPAKRQRNVSGIYPLESQESPQYEYMPTVSFRQLDGRVCKISAVRQKPLANTLLPKNHTCQQKKSVIRRDSTVNVNPRQHVTIQDIINYEVNHPTEDLTDLRATEPNKVHEIDHSMQDYQSNTNRQYEQNNANSVKLSYQGRTLVDIVPEKTTERVQNRKFYKNRQTKSNTTTGWGIETDQEPKVKRAKSNKDIYDLSLNTTHGSTLRFSHKAKEYGNQVPASTNNKVVPKIISAPMSREQRFDQEIVDRNMEHARNVKYARNNENARNVDHSKNIDYTRSAEHRMNMEDYIHTTHVNYAKISDVRSFTELDWIDHPRNVDPNKNHARNAEHARNTDLRAIEAPRTQTDLGNQYQNISSFTDVPPHKELARINHAKNVDPNKNYAGNAEHARNTDLRFIEPPRTQTDLGNQYPNISSFTDVPPHRELASIDHAKNIDPNKNYARNTDLRAIEPPRTQTDLGNQYQNISSFTDVPPHRELARIDHTKIVDPNKNYARNTEHARNTDLRAIEPPRTQTDLGNQYQDISSSTDVLPYKDYTQHTGVQYHYSFCNHNQIKAQQRLPRISEVFSQFNDEAYKKLTQPLYIKVSEESNTAPITMTIDVNDTCLIEKIYNFKSQFLTNPPLRQILPPQTDCTFITNTVPTAVEQSSAGDYSTHYHPYERASAHQLHNKGDPSCSYEFPKPEGQPYEAYDRASAHQLHNKGDQSCSDEFPKPEGQPYEAYDRASAHQLHNKGDQSCSDEFPKPEGQPYEVLNSPTATIDTLASQDLGDIDTDTKRSPEMVDDALELISQDGDYMERIGMDVRVQCILSCEWAGPKSIMEYHLKKEHHREIHYVSSATFRVQLSLSLSLCRRVWSSQLLQYRDTLCALSAQCNETTLLLAFSVISNNLEIPGRCRITVWNERLKTPLDFECDVQNVPDSMPYEYGLECLAIDVANLNLIPDRDNSMLFKRELVGKKKQPLLDSVELAVYIQLFD